MASGTIKGTTYISGHYWLELDWVDTKVSSTTSNVVVKTYFCSDWSASFSAAKNGSTTVNGSALNWTSDTNVNHSQGGTERTLIYTRSAVAVTHNADGTKSITISGTYTPNITISGYGTISTMSASGTAVLTDTVTTVTPNVWIWNGSAWVRAKAFKVWNGAGWEDMSKMQAWNGTAWVNTK